MMMAKWIPSTGTAQVLDGPWPVSFRNLPVHRLEVDGWDFCVGRI